MKHCSPKFKSKLHVSVADNAKPIYLRYPILVTNGALRNTLVNSLQHLRLGVTTSYPRSLVDVDELRGKLEQNSSTGEGGRQVASQILTLPTHHFVSAADRRKLVSVIVDAVS